MTRSSWHQPKPRWGAGVMLDARLALRLLARDPVFTATAAVVLALGHLLPGTAFATGLDRVLRNYW